MMRTERHRHLQRLLRLHGECSVEFLAGELNVSGMTIRRDLQELAQQQRVVRTHGSAAPAERVLFDFPYLREAGQHRQAKLAIGARAAQLVEDGQSVLLDSGTTTLALARHLVRRQSVVVLTTSIPIAAVLQAARGVETVLLGGVLRRDAPDLAGPLTESNLDQLHADLAFIGADAVGVNGALYNASMAVGRMLARMSRRAGSTYVVADSSKIGRTALSQFGNVAQMAGLITDAGLTAAQKRGLERAGVSVLIVDPLDDDPTDDAGHNEADGATGSTEATPRRNRSASGGAGA